MYDAQLVQDVSDIVAEYTDVIPDAAFAQGAYAGIMTGVPYDLKGVVMYRNTSIMPDAATDIDDLIAKSDAVSTGDVYGFVGETGSFFAMGHLHKVGGLMTPEGDPILDGPEGVAWAEMLAKFALAGPVSNNDDNDVNLFKTGNAGVIIDGTWNIGSFTDLGDAVVIDQWPNGMSGFVQSSFLFLNANATGDQAAAAKAFMSFLLSAEAQTAFYQADPSFIPANSQATVDDPLRLQAMQAFAGGVGFITIPEMNAYWNPVNDAVLAIVNDGADIPSTLATAKADVQAAVDEIRNQ
jgi:arabinogalactan oligomer/maltooligosaccharide transport system substrate-binding protein